MRDTCTANCSASTLLASTGLTSTTMNLPIHEKFLNATTLIVNSTANPKEVKIPTKDEVESFLNLTGFTTIDDMMDRLNSRDNETITVGSKSENSSNADTSSSGCCSVGESISIAIILALIGIVVYVLLMKDVVGNLLH